MFVINVFCAICFTLFVLSAIANFTKFWGKTNKESNNIKFVRPSGIIERRRRKFEFLARLQNNQKVRYSDIPKRATPDCVRWLFYCEYWSNIYTVAGSNRRIWYLYSIKINSAVNILKKKWVGQYFQAWCSSFLLNYLLQWSHSLRSLLGKRASFYTKQCFSPHELLQTSF